jgi:hypothetical protein
MRQLFVFILCSTASAQALSAQGFGRIQETQTNTASFFHAVPGEATVKVSVLGTVRVPGIYVVGAGTRLDELFAMSGGPTERETPDISSDVAISLFREEGETRQLIYHELLQSMLNEPGMYPALAEGDVLMVQTNMRRKFGWRDGLSVMTAVGTLALIVERLIQ